MSNQSVFQIGRQAPHVGHEIVNDLASGAYEIITHNYMRSLWALLCLMAVCSYLAQRKWANLFNSNDVLRALLKLPGHEELRIVKKAEEARGYENLVALPSNTTATRSNSKHSDNGHRRVAELAEFDIVDLIRRASEQNAPNALGGVTKMANKMMQSAVQLLKSVEKISGKENEHGHLLDYYPNQLVYMLLARDSCVATLRLRKHMLAHALHSLLLTVMQFVLPWTFIGHHYTFYGYHYLVAWCMWARAQLGHLRSTTSDNTGEMLARVNSIDYELSARIWPTSTSCEVSQYGYPKDETFTVQCTVPINEISAKMFAVIWWLVAINILVELYTAGWIVCCSLSVRALEWRCARAFWPKARAEARFVASFRHKRARALAKAAGGCGECAAGETTDSQSVDSGNSGRFALSERDKKRIEAIECRTGARHTHAGRWRAYLSDALDRSRCSYDVEAVVGEHNHEDADMYYLFYLLFLRLGRSQTKTTQIICMTARALSKYLDNLACISTATAMTATPTTLRHHSSPKHKRTTGETSHDEDDDGDGDDTNDDSGMANNGSATGSAETIVHVMKP